VNNVKRCTPKRKRQSRHRVNIALSQDRWDRFKPVLRKIWQGSFTSWVEFAMECYSRDTCEGCPYNESDLDEKKGIGKS
jgi:hypothetical protein